MSNYGRKQLHHMRANTTVSEAGGDSFFGNQDTLIRSSLKDPASKRRVSDSTASRKDSSSLIRELSFDTGVYVIPPKSINTLQEVWSVKLVPNNFVSISKPSAAIDRLLAKRKKQHENAIDEMKDELATIYGECETEFRGRSTHIKIEINGIRKQIADVQDKLREIDLLDLRDKDCNVAWEEVEKFIGDEKGLIDKFYENLKVLEKKRLDRTKPIMKKYYDILHKISHLLPYEIQTDLENQIMHYNQAVLGNHRTYADLHLQMLLLADTAKMKIKDWMEELKMDSREAIRVNTLKVLELEKRMLKDTETLFLSREEGKLATSELSGKDKLMSEIISRLGEVVPFSCNDVAEWSIQLHDAVMSIDKCARYLVKMYKASLTRVFNGYYNQVQDFKIMSGNTYDTFEEDVELTDNMLKSVKNKHERVIFNLENLWEGILNRMQNSLKDTYAFLQDSGRVWERHFRRLSEAQDLVSYSLETTITKNDQSNQALEIRLNIEMDKLRQEFDESKMEKQLNGIYAILDSIQEKYTSDLEEECAAIKAYRELVEQEFPVLDAEIDQFFHMYPKENIRDDILTYPKNLAKISSDQNVIPKQLRMCEFQVSAVMNWQFGLIEMINLYRRRSASDILNMARIWEDDKIDDCVKRLETKLDIHSHRYTRIRMEVYEARIIEVRSHAERLEKHKLGVTKTLDNMFEELNDFTKYLKEMLGDYDNELAEIKDGVQAAQSSFTIKRLKENIGKITGKYEYSMKNSVNEFQDEATNKLSWLRETSASFIKEIKLFNENGNFGNEEAKDFCKSLTLCIKLVDQRKSAILSSIAKTQKESSPEIQRKCKIATDYINTVLKDLTFREEVIYATRKCSNFLEHEARDLFDKVEKLTDDYDKIVETYKINMKENLPILPLMDDWIESLDYVNVLVQYLDVPFENITVPVSGKYDLKEKGLNQGESGAPKEKKASKAKPPAKIVDYRSLLFNMNDPPPKEPKFVPIVVNMLWDTFIHIQDKTMGHFSSLGNREITKPDLMKSNYHDFMEEILLKLQYYHIQIRDVWNVELKGFLCTVEKLKRTVSKWIANCFKEFDEQTTPPLVLKLEEMARLVHRVTVNGYAKRKDMTASLKIMHGYPGNKHLLDKLNDNVLATEKAICNEVSNTLESSKKEFDEQFQLHQPVIKNISEQLGVVLDKSQLLDKTVQLQDFVGYQSVTAELSVKSSSISGKPDLVREEAIDKTVMKMPVKNEKKTKTKKISIVEERPEEVMEKLSVVEIVIPPEHQLSFPNLVKHLKSRPSVSQRSSISRKSLSSSSVKLLDPRLSLAKRLSVALPVNLALGIDSVVETYVEKLTDIFSSRFVAVTNEVQMFLNEGVEFKASWHHDVKMVAKAFNVTYVCDDDLTEKIEMKSGRQQ